MVEEEEESFLVDFEGSSVMCMRVSAVKKSGDVSSRIRLVERSMPTRLLCLNAHELIVVWEVQCQFTFRP